MIREGMPASPRSPRGLEPGPSVVTLDARSTLGASAPSLASVVTGKPRAQSPSESSDIASRQASCISHVVAPRSPVRSAVPSPDIANYRGVRSDAFAGGNGSVRSAVASPDLANHRGVERLMSVLSADSRASGVSGVASSVSRMTSAPAAGFPLAGTWGTVLPAFVDENRPSRSPSPRLRSPEVTVRTLRGPDRDRPDAHPAVQGEPHGPRRASPPGAVVVLRRSSAHLPGEARPRKADGRPGPSHVPAPL
jgi:hypothetical protein